mgnify:CR=1 FL=1
MALHYSHSQEAHLSTTSSRFTFLQVESCVQIKWQTKSIEFEHQPINLLQGVYVAKFNNKLGTLQLVIATKNHVCQLDMYTIQMKHVMLSTKVLTHLILTVDQNDYQRDPGCKQSSYMIEVLSIMSLLVAYKYLLTYSFIIAIYGRPCIHKNMPMMDN